MIDDNYYFKEKHLLLNVELIKNGQLVREIKGTVLVKEITGKVLHNLGASLRGVTPLASSKLTHHLKATRVYCVGMNNFIVYKDLPYEIEGKHFKFEEKYIGDNANEIPVMQKLTVSFGKGEERVFEFWKSEICTQDQKPQITDIFK